jgi:hypothetical protein
MLDLANIDDVIEYAQKHTPLLVDLGENWWCVHRMPAKAQNGSAVNLFSPHMPAEQLFLMSQMRAQFPLAVYLSNMFMASDVNENGCVVTTSVGVGWSRRVAYNRLGRKLKGFTEAASMVLPHDVSMYDLIVQSNDNITVNYGRTKRNLCSFMFVSPKLQELLEDNILYVPGLSRVSTNFSDLRIIHYDQDCHLCHICALERVSWMLEIMECMPATFDAKGMGLSLPVRVHAHLWLLAFRQMAAGNPCKTGLLRLLSVLKYTVG